MAMPSAANSPAAAWAGARRPIRTRAASTAMPTTSTDATGPAPAKRRRSSIHSLSER
jgi:hypothetical protein